MSGIKNEPGINNPLIAAIREQPERGLYHSRLISLSST